MDWGRALEILSFLAMLAFHPEAQARVLEVGPLRELKAPSAAAAIAKDGDTVRIDPGEYFDCAMWRANGLTIEGASAVEGSATVISDMACAGKALFVISGNDARVRDLTLTRVRVADGNGAGIRMEGRDLTVERTKFVNNQTGILAADSPASRIHIADSLFLANGACSERSCVGALMIGTAAELVVERSVFEGTKGGHHIVSAATETVLRSNRIADGAAGTAGYGVQYAGNGQLLMQDNLLEKGPNTGNRRAEVLAWDGAWGAAKAIVLRRNRYLNNSGSAAPLLVNWTDAAPVLEENSLVPDGTEVSSRGIWLHRLRYVLISVKDELRHLAGQLRHAL